jgi:hypothetical protein
MLFEPTGTDVKEHQKPAENNILQLAKNQFSQPHYKGCVFIGKNSTDFGRDAIVGQRKPLKYRNCRGKGCF